MLAVERKNYILGLLQTEKRVVVAELAKTFDVSEETIRRDLDKLEREGRVQKSYGGAVLNDAAQSDMPLSVRKRTNVEGKQKIAELLAEYIPDNSSLMLDSSSTALFIVKRIKDRKNMVIITNSLEILVELKKLEDFFERRPTRRGFSRALRQSGGQNAFVFSRRRGDNFLQRFRYKQGVYRFQRYARLHQAHYARKLR